MSRAVVKGIDLSVYQGAVLPPCWAAMAQDGVKVAVVGSWHGHRVNPFAMGDLVLARQAGLVPATYIVVNGRYSGRVHVDMGALACRSQWVELSFAAIDVEVQGVTEEILDDALARVVEGGRRPAIYTGRWFWNWWALALGHLPGLDRPGGVSRYASFPLWTAFYDGRPTLDVPLYGGWQRAVGHQYAGTTTAYGTQVDLNVFDAEWVVLPPPPPPPPPPPSEEAETMSSKEYRELRAALERESKRIAAVKGQLADHIKGHPKPAPAPAPKPGPRYHTVVSGDTAGQIAEHYGVSWDQFKAINPGQPRSGDWNLIHPGERFRVA